MNDSAPRKDPIPFQPFDENGQVRVYYHGLLPHWRQTGCTYFVTFRLADSIPKQVLQQLDFERTQWLRARGISVNAPDWQRELTKIPGRERRIYEQLVGQLLNKALDECHGSCVLRNVDRANQVAAALDYFHGMQVLTGDFIVMPNHVHALMTPLPGFELEDVLHSIKSYTANRLNQAVGRSGRFWQKESYDHIVRDAEQLRAFQSYILANPSKAKLAKGEYVYASADYC
jgi:putative transposase